LHCINAVLSIFDSVSLSLTVNLDGATVRFARIHTFFRSNKRPPGHIRFLFNALVRDSGLVSHSGK